MIFGRAATDAEVKAALSFLTTEPLKDYEERKAEEEQKKATERQRRQGWQIGRRGCCQEHTRRACPGQGRDAEKNADGMMAGVVPGAGYKEDEAKLLPVTPWGRYLKVLLSSSEFSVHDH